MSIESEAYVRATIALYRRLTGATARTCRRELELARQWQALAIPLALIEAALRLAIARRNDRPPDAAPLPAIRSLHYLVPIIDELQRSGVTDTYLDYLRHRTRASQGQQPAPVQIHAVSDDR
jgi:hypothetical protein